MSARVRAKVAQEGAAPAERKGAYHHGNLRSAVVERALELLEEHGAADLSLRLVARQLGVSQTAPYHHFPDKNALLAALAAEGFRRSTAALLSRSLKNYSLERRVRGLCSGYIRFARETPELFRLMFGTQMIRKSEHPELVEAATACFMTLMSRVDEMLVDFDIRHVDAKYATMTLWGLNHGLASFVIDRQMSPVVAEVIGDGKQLIEQATRLFVVGLKPRPDEPAGEA